MRCVRCEIQPCEGYKHLKDAQHEEDRKERDDLEPAGPEKLRNVVDPDILKDKVKNKKSNDGVIDGINDGVVWQEGIIKEELANDNDEKKNKGERDQPVHEMLDLMQPELHGRHLRSSLILRFSIIPKAR